MALSPRVRGLSPERTHGGLLGFGISSSKAMLPWIALALGMLLLPGCLTRDVWSDLPHDWAVPRIGQANSQPEVHRRAVLFVIDDSASMADKQAVLAAAINDARIVIESCHGPGGDFPPTNGACPTSATGWKGKGLLTDYWVITTSLEAGGQICSGTSRHARPIDPPPGASLADVESVGEDGCGFEAPLEAMYRFLVDPEPPLSVSVRGQGPNKATFAEGIDEELLAKRGEFLAPFSSLTVVILTDEDDASVMDAGDAWKLGEDTIARGTAVCETDPTSRCCRPCDSLETEAPQGCAPLEQDSNCTKPALTRREAPLNTRAWAQKRRFGKDRLFPIQRYTEALSSPTITNRRGETIQNPLFRYGATPDMISVLLLSGVPWQLITKPESHAPGRALEFYSFRELETANIWSRLLGDTTLGGAPSDPHLIESITPRPGLPLPGTSWDPIHGHELVAPGGDSLQYSCIFALPQPAICTDASGCSCGSQLETTSPLCRQEDGSYGEPQRYAGAFPPARLMEFARSLGAQAALGSICPKHLRDPTEPGFGYADFIHPALLARGSSYHRACFTPSLPTNDDGTPKCKLLEFYRDQHIDCEALGRGPVGDEFRAPFRLTRDESGTLCEIPRMPGDPADPNSDYYSCAHELHPSLEGEGYCYIDQKLGLGSAELVVPCVDSHKRFFRSIPAALGHAGTEVGLVCDYR